MFYIATLRCFDSKLLNIYYFLIELLVTIFYSMIFYSSISEKRMNKNTAYYCIYVVTISWVLFMIFNLVITLKTLRDKIKSMINNKKATPVITLKTTKQENYQNSFDKNRIVKLSNRIV